MTHEYHCDSVSTKQPKFAMFALFNTFCNSERTLEVALPVMDWECFCLSITWSLTRLPGVKSNNFLDKPREFQNKKGHDSPFCVEC